MFYPKMLPGKFEKLESLLFDEPWCQRYFLSIRWPEGFTCSRCRLVHYFQAEPSSTVCSRCGNPFPITSGTLLHGTKKSISMWLRAVWLMCKSPGALSIRMLQHMLELQNYQTARSWLHKLRYARATVTKKKCSGTVEIEGCRLHVKKEKCDCHLIIALEVNVKTNSTGRIRMTCCRDLSPDSLEQFLHYCVKENSTLLLPDRHPYDLHRSNNYLSITESPSSPQKGSSRLLNSFKACCLTGSSTVYSLKRLEALCDDFCFQENRKLYPDRLTVFETLVAGMTATPALPGGSSHTYRERTDGET